MTLEADILFSIVANETDAVDFATDVRTTKVEDYTRLTNGTGSNQAQVAWSDKREAAVGQYDTLSTSSLVDERGTITIQGVKLIYFKNTGENPIFFNPNTANPFTSLFGDPEGSPQWFTLPVGTTAMFSRPGTGSLGGGTISVYAPFGPVSYDIVIIARGFIT